MVHMAKYVILLHKMKEHISYTLTFTDLIWYRAARSLKLISLKCLHDILT